MSVSVAFPDRQRMQVVILERCGMGWRVGIGGMLSGRIEREERRCMSDREAEQEATALADAHDLIAVRA